MRVSFPVGTARDQDPGDAPKAQDFDTLADYNAAVHYHTALENLYAVYTAAKAMNEAYTKAVMAEEMADRNGTR